jgi:hypothetical protein
MAQTAFVSAKLKLSLSFLGFDLTLLLSLA